MILIEKWDVVGLEPAIRGMRNPLNSWEKGDSFFCKKPDEKCSVCEGRHTDACYNGYVIGPNDHQLMMSLAKGGPVHAKYRRMIIVYADITAPLYWWKEFDTYKVGTVANSCSTMHKIHEKEFVLADFSTEHLIVRKGDGLVDDKSPLGDLRYILGRLNYYRDLYLATKDKTYWWQMIQLLPSSYNQKRTVMLNYEVINNIRNSRANHKLDEWRVFCKWTDALPYINDICPYGGNNDE